MSDEKPFFVPEDFLSVARDDGKRITNGPYWAQFYTDHANAKVQPLLTENERLRAENVGLLDRVNIACLVHGSGWFACGKCYDIQTARIAKLEGALEKIANYDTLDGEKYVSFEMGWHGTAAFARAALGKEKA